ncbi:hypothetical protein [Spirosoma luteum]|uniref:hypothetical protein n=1 Tax=Spirosoma luteum TaxID=431553 RepID=UPI0012F9102F|nr:hypothetical protein [Spirosoma luteum]
MAARVDPTTGVSHCSKQEMNRFFSALRVNLSLATAELIDAGLVAKGKKLDTYYLNPKAFQVVTLPTL